jgi:PIN domain nuclease of toxin-antitoxin system
MQVSVANAKNKLPELIKAVEDGDPFDRQIIAQALSEKISIVTSDRKFHLYKGIDVIW